MKNIFSKTRISNIYSAMKEAFPDKNIDAVFSEACTILESELKNIDCRESMAIKNHLRKNILPGFSCYKALLNAGVSQDQAIDFIEVEMCKAVLRMSRICKKLSSKKYAYPVFRFAFVLGMKFLYPKQGWTVEYIENSNKRIRMNITSCLYCQELKKRDALALCRAFCQTDHAAYDPLAPGVVFIRNNTLANTEKQCDFCFERGIKNK